MATRRLHKWLAAFVGVQVLIWALTGLYMTAVHIDIIHGDHFVRAEPPPLLPVGALFDPLAAASRVPGARNVRLSRLIERPVYIVEGRAGSVLFDARSGAVLPRPGVREIRAIAEHWFVGGAPLSKLELIQVIPREIRGRKPPLWRAEFDGWNKPTLYLSQETGELVSRRHELWRAFDFLWMLHIMDYDERENVNNTLLRIFTTGAALMGLSGAWLLLSAFAKRRKAARP